FGSEQAPRRMSSARAQSDSRAKVLLPASMAESSAPVRLSSAAALRSVRWSEPTRRSRRAWALGFSGYVGSVVRVSVEIPPARKASAMVGVEPVGSTSRRRKRSTLPPYAGEEPGLSLSEGRRALLRARVRTVVHGPLMHVGFVARVLWTVRGLLRRILRGTGQRIPASVDAGENVGPHPVVGLLQAGHGLELVDGGAVGLVDGGEPVRDALRRVGDVLEGRDRGGLRLGDVLLHLGERGLVLILRDAVRRAPSSERFDRRLVP